MEVKIKSDNLYKQIRFGIIIASCLNIKPLVPSIYSLEQVDSTSIVPA